MAKEVGTHAHTRTQLTGTVARGAMGYWGGGVGACCAIPPRAPERRSRRESARPCARAHAHTHAHPRSLTQTSTAAWRPCGGPSIKSFSTASRIAISICPYDKSAVGAGSADAKSVHLRVLHSDPPSRTPCTPGLLSLSLSRPRTHTHAWIHAPRAQCSQWQRSPTRIHLALHATNEAQKEGWHGTRGAAQEAGCANR